MGQVPRYGIVGDGRMARHFRRYLGLLGIPARQWSRRQEGRQGITLETALQEADVILVLIRDGAVQPFVQEHADFFSERTAIHFSGALVTPLARGFHPLMTFGEEFYSLSEYQSMAFVGERGGPAFQEIFPALPNPSFSIAPEQRALYHSLCVLSGNFTVLLWQKFFSELEGRLEIPREAALPYLRRITANIERDAETALTGPLQRKDTATIQANLEALGGDPFGGVYQSFVRAVSPEVLR